MRVRGGHVKIDEALKQTGGPKAYIKRIERQARSACLELTVPWAGRHRNTKKKKGKMCDARPGTSPILQLMKECDSLIKESDRNKHRAGGDDDCLAAADADTRTHHSWARYPTSLLLYMNERMYPSPPLPPPNRSLCPSVRYLCNDRFF